MSSIFCSGGVPTSPEQINCMVLPVFVDCNIPTYWSKISTHVSIRAFDAWSSMNYIFSKITIVQQKSVPYAMFSASSRLSRDGYLGGQVEVY